MTKGGLYCFIGFEGSGKTFESQKFVDKGAVRVSFATTLRKIVFELLGGEPKDYDLFKKECCLEYLQSGVIKTGRQVMEDVATAIRSVNPAFFIEAAEREITEALKRGDAVVIDDCRYTNELALVKRLIDVYDGSVVFCNYKSTSFNDSNTHPSTYLARSYYLQNMSHLAIIY
jgi:hypothetical protein